MSTIKTNPVKMPIYRQLINTPKKKELFDLLYWVVSSHPGEMKSPVEYLSNYAAYFISSQHFIMFRMKYKDLCAEWELFTTSEKNQENSSTRAYWHVKSLVLLTLFKRAHMFQVDETFDEGECFKLLNTITEYFSDEMLDINPIHLLSLVAHHIYSNADILLRTVEYNEKELKCTYYANSKFYIKSNKKLETIALDNGLLTRERYMELSKNGTILVEDKQSDEGVSPVNTNALPLRKDVTRYKAIQIELRKGVTQLVLNGMLKCKLGTLTLVVPRQRYPIIWFDPVEGTCQDVPSATPIEGTQRLVYPSFHGQRFMRFKSTKSREAFVNDLLKSFRRDIESSAIQSDLIYPEWLSQYFTNMIRLFENIANNYI